MKISKMAFVGGMALSAFAGMGLAACSSGGDNTPPNTQPGGDGGTDTGATPTTDSGTTPPVDSGATPPTDSGATDSGQATCAKPPTLHVPQPDGGLYCPFSYNDATDAGIQYCSGATQQCCVSPASDAGSSTCEPAGPCASATFKVWQCSAPSDCANIPVDAGSDPVVCCLISGNVGPDKNCAGYKKTAGLDSVSCVGASQCQGPIMTGGFTDTHYVACEQQSDCDQSAAAFGGDGGTCTPVKTSGTPIGLCL